MNEPLGKPASYDPSRDASNPNASVWVSANAGSGKTYALTNRVARLLLAGTQPDRILCLTFTKAAAAEMSARLFKRLGEWAMADDASLEASLCELEGENVSRAQMERARQLFARALETPGGLKIQTIHAFCERVLHRFPLEAGLPPHFEVLDDRTGAELMAGVRDQLLQEACTFPESELGQAFAHIVRHVNELTFGDITREIAGNRNRFETLFEREGSLEGAYAAVRRTLGVREGETEESLTEDIFPHAHQGYVEEAVHILPGYSKSDDEQAERLQQALNGDHAAYLSIFLTQKEEPRKRLLTKKAGDENFEIKAFLDEEQGRIIELNNRLRAVHVAQSTHAVLVLARRLIDAYAEAKRARAMLDYEDLIEETRRLLLRSSMAAWVLFKLDGGLDHILVDEAQDTSPAQWDVIRVLAEEFLSGDGARDLTRTLFAVGDEKQSIFSFQGADPKGFDEMRRHFEHRVQSAGLLWSSVRLVRSFRSTPEVLAAVDRVFLNPQARDGLSALGNVDEHQPVRVLDHGRVELWEIERPSPQEDADPWDAPLDYVGEENPMARLAGRIADTIAGWLAKGETLPALGRPVRAGDVLILVRRRNAFVQEMIRALKKRSIPVAGRDRMILGDQLAVMDLVALGQFALLPEDDLTLATVLKSPLGGLSEDALFELAARRTGTLWQALRQRSEEAAYGEACGFLSQVLARADFLRPFEFFAWVLSSEGGRRRMLARLGAEARDPLDEFLALAQDYERAHAPSLQGFLDWIARGGAEIKRDMDQGRDEVRIMTVHGSKGLEAPIVFLPDTLSVPSGRNDPALIPQGESDRLLLWPVKKTLEDTVTASAREARRLEEAQEYRRLLYVGLTRPRDRLYVCGWHNRPDGEAPEGSWYALVAEALKPVATEMTDEGGGTIWRLEGHQQQVPEVKPQAADVDVEALPDWASREAPHEASPTRPLTPSRLPLGNSVEPPARLPLEDGDASRFMRGRLIHRLLQMLPQLGVPHRHAAAARFLALPAHGLEPDAQAEILAAVFATLDDPAFSAFFGNDSRSEVPLVGEIDLRGARVVISGQVDRLRVTPQEVLVIDYKTNREPPRQVEETSLAYLLQMAAYRALLVQIYPDRPVRAALLWTDGPHLMELDGRMLDNLLES